MGVSAFLREFTAFCRLFISFLVYGLTQLRALLDKHDSVLYLLDNATPHRSLYTFGYLNTR